MVFPFKLQQYATWVQIGSFYEVAKVGSKKLYFREPNNNKNKLHLDAWKE